MDTFGRHKRKFTRVKNMLVEARTASELPDETSCRAELDDLLVRVRMKHL